jgi:hypothetical protein
MGTFNGGIFENPDEKTFINLAEILGITYQEVVMLSPRIEEIKCHPGEFRQGYKIIFSTKSGKQLIRKLTFKVTRVASAYEIFLANPYLFDTPF